MTEMRGSKTVYKVCKIQYIFCTFIKLDLFIKIVSHQNVLMAILWMLIMENVQTMLSVVLHMLRTDKCNQICVWNEMKPFEQYKFSSQWHRVVTDYLIICGLCCIRNAYGTATKLPFMCHHRTPFIRAQSLCTSPHI